MMWRLRKRGGIWLGSANQFMSLNTNAESTLMISTGSFEYNSTATPVLPLAVGPIKKMAEGSCFIDILSQ